MITDNAAQDQFLSEHRWGVLTTLRKNGQPVSSVVAYVREGDDLLVSTPGTTFKRRSLDRDPRATLCVVSNGEPFNFVSVEGTVDVQTEDLVAGTRAIFAAIADVGYSEPADFENWLEREQRVLLRLHPARVNGVIR